MEETIQQKSVNAIRILSAEAITRARSGHPGICMDAAPIGYTLYADVMKYSNKDPEWQNRDRFVLSAGHVSMLLYSLLYLFGFGLTKEDLMNFRQFGSKTPGHPEHGVTPGVPLRGLSARALQTPWGLHWRRHISPLNSIVPV